jgi:pimeloyl-ACP methyl ester carboxylesterase
MSRRPVEGFVTATDATRIAYRDHGGRGRGLVLLHGGGANLESMDQFAERLGGTHRCVAIDVRACGRSDDPPRFRLTDAASDVADVVRVLDLGPSDVLGHSMGGFVAGYYGTSHPARIVSIDGFGPGVVTVGRQAQRKEFQAFQEANKAAFFAMTAPPESGDRAWRDQQVEELCAVLPRLGYTAPNGRAMAERNLVDLGGGLYVRRPPRHLFADAFDDEGGADVLRMYRRVQGQTMIVRCTRSGAPAVLDTALDELTADNDRVQVVRMPLTHLAPAWDAIDEVVEVVERFLSEAPLPRDESGRVRPG